MNLGKERNKPTTQKDNYRIILGECIIFENAVDCPFIKNNSIILVDGFIYRDFIFALEHKLLLRCWSNGVLIGARVSVREIAI